MSKHDLQERLINGFSRHGYGLYADDGSGISNEFRKVGEVLRFVVRYGEGGVTLFWTELPDYDLLNAKMMEVYKQSSTDVQFMTFSGSPDDFWQAVKDITEGTRDFPL